MPLETQCSAPPRHPPRALSPAVSPPSRTPRAPARGTPAVPRPIPFCQSRRRVAAAELQPPLPGEMERWGKKSRNDNLVERWSSSSFPGCDCEATDLPEETNVELDLIVHRRQAPSETNRLRSHAQDKKTARPIAHLPLNCRPWMKGPPLSPWAVCGRC